MASAATASVTSTLKALTKTGAAAISVKATTTATKAGAQLFSGLSSPRPSSSLALLSSSTATVMATVKTTTEPPEIPKRVLKPQTVGDILAFISLTLGSYLVGALLAIVFKALFNYVQNKYRRKSSAMLNVQQQQQQQHAPLLDPQLQQAPRRRSVPIGNSPVAAPNLPNAPMPRWRMNNATAEHSRRLSTIFEAVAYESEEMVEKDEDYIEKAPPPLPAHPPPTSCYSVTNQSYDYDLVVKSPQTSQYMPTPVPAIKIQKPPTPERSSSLSSSSSSSLHLQTLLASPRRPSQSGSHEDLPPLGSRDGLDRYTPPVPPLPSPVPLAPLRSNIQYTNYGHPPATVLIRGQQGDKQYYPYYQNQQQLLQAALHQHYYQNYHQQPLYIIECFGVGEDV